LPSEYSRDLDVMQDTHHTIDHLTMVAHIMAFLHMVHLLGEPVHLGFVERHHLGHGAVGDATEQVLECVMR